MTPWKLRPGRKAGPWKGSGSFALLVGLSLGAIGIGPWIGLGPTAWAHQTEEGLSQDEDALEIRLRVLDVYPPVPVADLAAFIGAEGQALIQWTSPHEDNVATPSGLPATFYTVKYSTLGIVDFGGSTTAWWNQGLDAIGEPAPAAPGTLQPMLFTDLFPGDTVYFGIQSTDERNNVSPIDANAATPGAQARAFVKGIAGVLNLTATPSPLPAAIQLTWTEPGRFGVIEPLSYEIKVSTLGQISNQAEFNAALPLSAFSGSIIPAPGPADGTVAMMVENLFPTTTYYFAIRMRDSSAPSLLGRWQRNVPADFNTNNFAEATFIPGVPNAVADFNAVEASTDTAIHLTWTSPANFNLVPMSNYVVKYSSMVSIADLGGDTTAWFDLTPGVTSFTLSPVRAPGSAEAYTVQGLLAGATYYAAIKSVDVFGETSPIDAQASSGFQARAPALNLPPATPQNFLVGLGRAKLTGIWDDLTPLQKGLDFVGYRVRRSSASLPNFEVILLSTATDFKDSNVKPGVLYCYFVVGVDLAGQESLPTPTLCEIPLGAPLPPVGLKIQTSSGTSALVWEPVTRFETGEPFASSTAPVPIELNRYSIYRSTGIVFPYFVLASSVPPTTTTYVDPSLGNLYYYQVKAENTFIESEGSLVVDVFGNVYALSDDGASRVEIPKSLTGPIYKETSSTGEDVHIRAQNQVQELGGKVFKSVRFQAYRDGGLIPVEYLPFSGKLQVALHYAVDETGIVVASTGAVTLKASASALALTPNIRIQNSEAASKLGLYWNNGAQFLKVYGRIDPSARSARIEAAAIGGYQIRSILRDAGVTFDLSNISSRVLTPNGDGLNDLIIFRFDNPRRSPIEGKIFDLYGAYVADMTAGTWEDTLVWDGRSGGRTAPSGVYIYQVKGEDKRFNGTIVVAR